jgi:hypothetical protein
MVRVRREADSIEVQVQRICGCVGVEVEVGSSKQVDHRPLKIDWKLVGRFKSDSGVSGLHYYIYEC